MSFHCFRSRGSRRTAGKRQQSDVAGALDCDAQPALVTRANAGHAARKNFSALLHELRQNVRALVVDQVHLFHAELANFLFAEILPLAAAWSPRTTARAALATTFATRSAFAPRATMTTLPTVSPFALPPAFRAWRFSRGCCLLLLLFLCHFVHPFSNFRKSCSYRTEKNGSKDPPLHRAATA